MSDVLYQRRAVSAAATQTSQRKGKMLADQRNLFEAGRATEAQATQLKGATLADNRNDIAQRKQAKAKSNGLPAQLKNGIEQLSGMSMDHVNVHYNSAKPAQLNAHAYAQGSDIHLAAGQEKHLPHEAWHVVQQAQGRVKPTMQMKGGVTVNDNELLEREADEMGQRSSEAKGIVPDTLQSPQRGGDFAGLAPVQRVIHKKGLNSKVFGVIRKSGIYQENKGSPAKRDLILKLHASTEDFSLKDVEGYLDENPLPDVTTCENRQQSSGGGKGDKPNSAAKKKHKRKSASVSRLNKNKAQDYAYSSSGGIKKRRIEKGHFKRGDILVKLGERVYREILSDKKSNPMQKIIDHTRNLSGDKLSRKIPFGNKKIHVRTKPDYPKDLNGRLALTHVSLQGVDKRSSYAAMVRPDSNQSHGALHPLVNFDHNPSLQALNAIEATRNGGQFISSMVLKEKALEGDHISIKNAINPTKFGTNEISGVSGQDRDDYKNIVSANTYFILEHLVSKDNSGLQKDMMDLIEAEEKDEDVTDMEDDVVEKIKKEILRLSGNGH